MQNTPSAVDKQFDVLRNATSIISTIAVYLNDFAETSLFIGVDAAVANLTQEIRDVEQVLRNIQGRLLLTEFYID